MDTSKIHMLETYLHSQQKKRKVGASKIHMLETYLHSEQKKTKTDNHIILNLFKGVPIIW